MGPLARRRRARGDQRGAVAVEFALIFPILVILLLGVTTAGIAYSRSVGVTNAVREGARFGATTLVVPSASPNYTNWANDVIAQVRATQFDDDSNETKICVQLWKVGTGPGTGRLGGNCSTGTPTLAEPVLASDEPVVPSGLTSGQCVVRVVAARRLSINIVFASWTPTYQSDAVARYERFPTATAPGGAPCS